MALAHEFAYFKPATVAEATRLLGRLGGKGRVLAGGTDLIGLISEELAHPEAVIDIKGIRTLQGIRYRNGSLTIGALTTFTDLRESASVARSFPVLGEMTKWVASAGVRNRATVVGNLCSAVPCCDSGPVLLLYDAVVEVAGPRGRRRIPLRDWFTGPRKTALRSGEIATAVHLARPREKHAGCFVKLRRYRGEDLAQASVAVLALSGGRFRVAFGAVAPTPIRSPRIEAFLSEGEGGGDLFREAARLVPDEIAAITDIRATREYRTHMVGVMLERGLRAAAARLAGGGPAYGTDLLEA
jgi:carbon-monoxide dehydrogenase medium subunit